MRKVFVLFFILVLSGVAGYFYFQPASGPSLPNDSQGQSAQKQISEEIPLATVIAQSLDTPWAIAFLPDGDMLVTERKGTVVLVDNDVTKEPSKVADIRNAKEIGEGGLLGITLHPEFADNNYVYLYYTYAQQGDKTMNRVVRMKYSNNTLTDERIILDQIPGAINHNGGRIVFGPDGYLYVTTGDAQIPSLSQDKKSLAGKILRITKEGRSAPGNPFNNEIYSYGHRNPQGISWDKNGQLWSTEHGPSGGEFGRGNDEVNIIQPGQNYGWPLIQGQEKRQGMKEPFVHSGRETTWAPGANANLSGKLFFTGLRGASLYSVDIEQGVVNVARHFENEYGRIREVVVGPDGMLYITTSNRDGRGIPGLDDDKIIRINPSKL